MAPVLSIVCSLYQGAKYLPAYLENARLQSVFDSTELIFVHNDPAKEEQRLISEFAKQANVKALEVGIEPLAASWNRGWQAANGVFVAIWNVDDQREPNSLALQVQALEAVPGAVASYGDYVEVPNFGSKEGKLRNTPEFAAKQFSRSFPQGGAFMVFRRDLLEKLGGFDEQFTVGPDMEYCLRIALTGNRMVRADGVMGYFTNESAGLSTRSTIQAAADRAAVYKRYAVYDKVDPSISTSDFDLDRISMLGKQMPLENYWPRMSAYRKSRQYLSPLGSARFAARNLLKSLGLLGLFHRLQASLIKRDL